MPILSRWASCGRRGRHSIFVSDSRSRMIRTLSGSRNECKASRSFFPRIISNARGKSIPGISMTYLYRWHFATSHRCPHTTSAVERPRWGDERKSFTLSEIRCNVIRDNIFRRVISSTVVLITMNSNLIDGISGMENLLTESGTP